ncbi:alpha/beta hydrolase [Phytomonospora endophytica]|uniref:Enterochelin esterase-like enzyme n=1 Tax=Phytomonospora endophytica TaxID=714109 RepID=A0A841FT72_9ACTN|nr:alpha/beta hydrolase-fold protein [Phytomonospora endophytica]MBB6039236.1 enterochelin esterase-like enzyme [Phytomonospora endophytica]
MITGTVVTTSVVAGLVSAAFLLLDTERKWWTGWGWVPVAVLSGAGAGVLAKVVVDVIWKPFPDKLPIIVCAAIAVSVAAIILAVGKMRRFGPGMRTLSVIATILVIGASAIQVNRYFGWYPSVAGLLGHLPVEPIGLDELDPADATISAPDGKSLQDVWEPPAGLPAHGALAEMDVPPKVSDFHVRSGWVWLPPAYLVTPRPVLPVLVLVGGQPGNPRDWIDSGQIVQMMDAYAAAHEGLAPIVAMPDSLGSPWANPMCLDTERGKSLTYLSVDVPAWIDENLSVAVDRKSWAFGGFSQGGTCSLIMAVNASAVYGRFIDLSGEVEPTIGTHEETLDEAFGGDAAAFDEVNPLDVMARERFPDTAGRFVVGEKDTGMAAGLQELHVAAQAAGMDVEYQTVPGGHDMNAWRTGMRESLPWLGDHTGLTAPL